MPIYPPLESTPDGRAHDVIDLANHVAERLEPRRITVDVADVAQTLIETATAAAADDMARLNTAARRWVRDHDPSGLR